MKTSRIFLLAIFSCLPCITRAQVTATAKPTESTAPLTPVPTIVVTGAKATPAGLDLDVQASNLGTMGIWVEKLNKVSGSWVTYVDGFNFAVPVDLRETDQPVGSSLVLPLLLAGKDTSYRVGVYGKNKVDDPRDWTYSNLLVFSGLDLVPKPITNSIAVEFADKSIKLSAETEEKAKLQASWRVGGHSGYGMTAASFQQDPYVVLDYATLPKESAGTFPAIDIALLDQVGNTLQEARIALKVASTQTVAGKVSSVKAQPDDSKKSTDTKFSWSELVKTGLGALMKFFLHV